MPADPRSLPVFQIDVSADAADALGADYDPDQVMIALLQQIVVQQNRQIELLEEIRNQLGAQQRQQAQELRQWRERHPDLARLCRSAAQALSRVQTEFLQRITEEVRDNEDYLMDGEFMLSEFVDRFGPRLAHLNGILHVLGQLSAPAPSAEASRDS